MEGNWAQHWPISYRQRPYQPQKSQVTLLPAEAHSSGMEQSPVWSEATQSLVCAYAASLSTVKIPTQGSSAHWVSQGLNFNLWLITVGNVVWSWFLWDEVWAKKKTRAHGIKVSYHLQLLKSIDLWHVWFSTLGFYTSFKKDSLWIEFLWKYFYIIKTQGALCCMRNSERHEET